MEVEKVGYGGVERDDKGVYVLGLSELFCNFIDCLSSKFKRSWLMIRSSSSFFWRSALVLLVSRLRCLGVGGSGIGTPASGES